MFRTRNRRRIDELEARVEQLVEQRDEARADATTHLYAAKRTAAYSTRVSREIYEVRNELAKERRRADHLQQRLDDAVGISHPDVDSGALWQQRRTDKPKPGPIGADL
ncbi:hypothetical protein [Streptomyces niveus]|uniref:hypothetical protein n=1 Tax=Streptomyces niveus TaxID=193462 RepID=UPI003439039E